MRMVSGLMLAPELRLALLPKIIYLLTFVSIMHGVSKLLCNNEMPSYHVLNYPVSHPGSPLHDYDETGNETHD